MEFYQHLLAKLQANQNIYLLTVIQNSGSSPGRKGFKMLVSEDGFIYGSIGGGVMEFSLVEATKKLLKEGTLKIFFKKQVHRGDKENGSGMICSGEQTVVFHPLNTDHIPLVKSLLSSIEGKKHETLVLTPTSIRLSKFIQKERFYTQINSDQDWHYREQVSFKNTLYIVGGGHVSVAVSQLFVTLGFKVVVFDDRENLNTLEQNTSAHQKTIIKFEDIAHHILEEPASFVAIMTNRYVDDKLVLSKLIDKNFSYLGVLGSTAKLKAMWEVLQREGFTSKQLANVHGPIGIPIKSQTPNEIAVSIAAEIIRIKNRDL